MTKRKRRTKNKRTRMAKSRKMARSRTKKLRKKKMKGGTGSDEINRPYTTIYDINGKPEVLKREEAVAEEKAKKVVLAVEGDAREGTEEKNFSVNFDIDDICGPDEDYSHIEVGGSFPFNLNRENIYYKFRGKNIHDVLGDKGKKICPKLKPYLTNRGYCCSKTPPPLSPDEEEPDPTPEYGEYEAPERAPRETLEEIRDLYDYDTTRLQRIPGDNLIKLSPPEISNFWYDKYEAEVKDEDEYEDEAEVKDEDEAEVKDEDEDEDAF